MRFSSKICFAGALSALVFVVADKPADARRWDPVEKCYPPVEGSGTGHGVFGRGSARARSEARADWEDRASSKYGRAYGRLHYAQDVQWDCKKGAVLTAKCVVTAKPCGARLRG